MEPMLNHVAWVIDDMQGVTDFLVEYFECEVGPARTITGPWADELANIPGVLVHYQQIVSKNTATRIALLKFIKPESAENTKVDELNLKGFRHIGFLVENIDRKVVDLKNGGYKFFSDVVNVDEFDARTVYLWGPEDAVIQLTAKMPAAAAPHG